MKFKVGDAIVHPIRGAGVVKRVEERRWRGSSDLYYTIELLSQPRMRLMIPTGAAKELGLRYAISQAKLKKVWRVLGTDPRRLPADHKVRYKLLEEKLRTGDILEVAEAVRDMAWRRRQRGKLNTKGKQFYDKGMMLLAGEVAVAQGVALAEAEAQVRTRLSESLAPATVT